MESDRSRFFFILFFNRMHIVLRMMMVVQEAGLKKDY